MTMDLSKLSLGELKKLQKDIDALIANQGKEAAAKARKDILAIAQSVGLTVDQLLDGSKPEKAVKKVAVQYQNPKNAAEQWTGRGRKPRWIVDAIEGGAKLEDFKTKDAA
jgi:DNA-binding protein H-NS